MQIGLNMNASSCIIWSCMYVVLYEIWYLYFLFMLVWGWHHRRATLMSSPKSGESLIARGLLWVSSLGPYQQYISPNLGANLLKKRDQFGQIAELRRSFPLLDFRKSRSGFDSALFRFLSYFSCFSWNFFKLSVLFSWLFRLSVYPFLCHFYCSTHGLPYVTKVRLEEKEASDNVRGMVRVRKKEIVGAAFQRALCSTLGHNCHCCVPFGRRAAPSRLLCLWPCILTVMPGDANWMTGWVGSVGSLHKWILTPCVCRCTFAPWQKLHLETTPAKIKPCQGSFKEWNQSLTHFAFACHSV